MEVKIVGVNEKNFGLIPRPARRNFDCQGCFYWVGKWDGKLDLVKHKRKWLARKALVYNGPLAKIALWGKREKPIGYVQFGPISEFQTATMLYNDRFPLPRGGWCVTCISLQRLYQKKGVARRLVQNLLRDFKRRGIKVVDVYELPEFWRCFGFETVFEDEKKKIIILRKKL